MEVINILKVIFEEGFKYAILAFGVYLTYSILDFPDLSVDGTMPLGAITSAVLILQGCNPWLSLLVAFAAGCVAGTITGLLHVKLKIRPLLCGILVYTACLSVNLVLIKLGTGGQSIASIFGKSTIFNTFPASLIPSAVGGVVINKLVLLFILVVIVKVVIDLYLQTKSGMLLRATGSNEQYVKMLAKNPGVSKILGLALGNGLAALSGAVIAQSNETANTTMGTGMVVLGLSSVIIGLSLFKKLSFMKATTMVLFGTLIYRACLQIAVVLGLPSDYNRLLMAVLFVLALVFSGRFDKFTKKKVKNSASA
ncbi:MAG TPA: ABC transporter permease [Candidatus Scubalenecus merdavium]|uniref:ABC transporter permease n=1 Tax=Candidatus Scybalenecus merdavium TaxID=2840939 RepID=A0A9D1MV82_9FIRM|nr:ABC transporter permease [Candidatus Scubalenecus merdavium]